MLFVTWRLRGSLRQRPHCTTTTALDRQLDRETGERLLLAQARYAGIVRRTILRYAGELYDLHAWVVLHNHVHLLIEPHVGISFIARTFMEETETAARRPLWVPQSYEQTVTAGVAELAHWIENHPVRSGLVSRPEEWEWSSARTEEVRRPLLRRGKRAAAA
jgi:putative transposase